MTKIAQNNVSTNMHTPIHWFARRVYPYILFILFFAIPFITCAQIDPQLLLGLNQATTTEMNAISGSITGSMLYNSTDKKIYFYNGTNWVTPSNDNWLLDGNTAVAGASFLGTKNDVAMDIRSNNTSILKFGRRQTLGLVQAYPDYTDQNQYLTYVGGANGVSALQFQADAASFYKPMFYTNSDGNFRLKGSAAGTDFFEIGSAGTSNNGEVEFIIGDDGAEPFIFKRYDYRDGLLKELLRVQGSSDSQNALPRVGINTGSLANSTLQVNGSMSNSITTTGSNLTLNETHHTVLINSNVNITLPAASGAAGRIYVLKNTTTSDRPISNYLDASGSTSNQISALGTLWVQSNGSTWNSISGATGSGGSDGQGNSLIRSIRTSSTNTTLTANDFTLIVTGKDRTISFPATATLGQVYVIKVINDDNETNIDYLDDKGDNKDELKKEKVYWFQYDGSNWQQISRD
jgi:hypothetical protein